MTRLATETASMVVATGASERAGGAVCPFETVQFPVSNEEGVLALGIGSDGSCGVSVAGGLGPAVARQVTRCSTAKTTVLLLSLCYWGRSICREWTLGRGGG
jgi:hypothetical protein